MANFVRVGLKKANTKFWPSPLGGGGCVNGPWPPDAFGSAPALRHQNVKNQYVQTCTGHRRITLVQPESIQKNECVFLTNLGLQRNRRCNFFLFCSEDEQHRRQVGRRWRRELDIKWSRRGRRVQGRQFTGWQRKRWAGRRCG